MNKKLALMAALVLVTPVLASFSVQAQTSPTNATTNSQLTNSNTANALGVTTGTPTTSQQQTSNRSPTTGVICIEEMTATFCNVPSGPNTNGYGSLGGSGSGSGTGSSGGSGSTGGSASAAATRVQSFQTRLILAAAFTERGYLASEARDQRVSPVLESAPPANAGR
jgi:hypothetical protein